MKFRDFIKDKIVQIFLMLFVLVTIEVLIVFYPFALFIKVYIPVCIIVMYILGLVIEYTVKSKYYNNLIYMTNELDEAYLVSEIIKSPNFLEGKIFNEVLEIVDKSMIENVNKYKFAMQDYKEYIELWIHEVKLPIATANMIIENNKTNVTKNLLEEINNIENYTEQALYYARSNTVEKDYYIRKVKIEDVINESIKKNKKALIELKAIINLHDLDRDIYTDNKWLIFILNQIIQNSIKYKQENENLNIEIFSKKNKDNTFLYIKDNGIGIKEAEISRVFEKGFTGTNGRIQSKKSTGIGLYLCKKLCNKLSIGIDIFSEYKQGTTVKLVFPHNSYTQVV